MVPRLCVVGLLAGFGISQFGLFTVPTGALLAFVLSGSHHAGRQALGLVVGVGLVALFVGVLASDPPPPCPPGGLTLGPGEASASCGGDTMAATHPGSSSAPRSRRSEPRRRATVERAKPV